MDASTGEVKHGGGSANFEGADIAIQGTLLSPSSSMLRSRIVEPEGWLEMMTIDGEKTARQRMDELKKTDVASVPPEHREYVLWMQNVIEHNPEIAIERLQKTTFVSPKIAAVTVVKRRR